MIPCECLGGVGFLFPFFIDFSPKEFGISYVTNSAIFPLFLLGYSIDTPSILHRWSIVSMEKRWRIDGPLMEYHWSNKDISVFVCRMDIDEKTCKYDNSLRLSRKRLLILGCKIRSNVLKCVKNEGNNCKNVLYFDCY